MCGGDRCVETAAHVELANHGRFTRLDGGDDVVKDLVGDRFVERALVAERPEVELVRLQLDAELVRNVADGDLREVWLAGDRAEAGELWRMNLDLVVALRVGI